MSEVPARQFKRLPTTKVMIAEASRTTYALPKPEGQFETQLYLSPTGRTIAKVMIVGTAIETEDIGKEKSLWRMRMTDHSGSIGVMAGSFQPEAMQAIAEIEVPQFVCVVGKINVYEPEEGSHIVSIRPDSITVIDAQTRQDLILDIGLSTVRSIKDCSANTECIEKLNAAYTDEVDLAVFRIIAQQMIEDLIDTPVKEQPEEKEEVKPPSEPNKKAKPDVEQNKEQEPEKKKPEKSKQKYKKTDTTGKAGKEIDAEIKTIYEMCLEIIKEHKQLTYVAIEEILKQRGVNTKFVDWDSAIKRIFNDGIAYEPKIGTVKYIG